MVLSLPLVIFMVLLCPGPTLLSTNNCHPCSCFVQKNHTILDCELLHLNRLPEPPNNNTLTVLLQHNRVTCDSIQKFVSSSYSSPRENWLDIRHNPNFNCSCISSLARSFGVIVSDCPPSTQQPRVLSASTSLYVNNTSSASPSISTLQSSHNPVSKRSQKLWISWLIGSSSGTFFLVLLVFLCKKVIKKCFRYNSYPTHRHLPMDTLHFELYGGSNVGNEEAEGEDILFDVTRL